MMTEAETEPTTGPTTAEAGSPGPSVPLRERLPRAAPWIGLLARLLLGGVLVVAGALKVVQSPTEQVRAVRAFELLPVGIDEVVGYGLPIAEIVIGVALLVGIGTRIAAVAGGLLMVAFTIGVASAWARGLAIDCGCFGGGGSIAPDQTRYPEEILRDLGLLVTAVWLLIFGPGRWALDRAMRPRTTGKNEG